MRKCYLLTHSSLVAPYQQMKKVLSSIPEVLTWRTDIPNCFYLVSEADANALVALIREKTGKNGRFIVSEITDNRNGWLTKESWYFINNKRAKPVEE